MKFEWNDELTDKLVAMVLGGKHSFSQIGAEIGCGKNGAIGKWHRIRDKRGLANLVPVKPRVSCPAGTRKVGRARPSKPAAAGTGAIMRPIKKPAPVAVYGEVCHILDVTGCRWPVTPDDCAKGDHRFCNAAQHPGSSYCEAHAHMNVAHYSSDLIRRTVKSTLAVLKMTRAA